MVSSLSVSALSDEGGYSGSVCLKAGLALNIYQRFPKTSVYERKTLSSPCRMGSNKRAKLISNDEEVQVKIN